MRAIFLPMLFLLASCGGQQEASNGQGRAEAAAQQSPLGNDLQVFAGAGKDRLCVAGVAAPAAVITYAADGQANCSARGRIDGQQGKLFFVPQEDTSCRVELRREGADRLTLGAPTPGCAYYCGPGASLEGKSFQRMAEPEPVTDLAGDPLC